MGIRVRAKYIIYRKTPYRCAFDAFPSRYSSDAYQRDSHFVWGTYHSTRFCIGGWPGGGIRRQGPRNGMKTVVKTTLKIKQKRWKVFTDCVLGWKRRVITKVNPEGLKVEP